MVVVVAVVGLGLGWLLGGYPCPCPYHLLFHLVRDLLLLSLFQGEVAWRLLKFLR